MPNDTIFDSTDKGTLRPNKDPLRKQGSAFKPMQLPQFGWEITLPEDVSPDNPITLFTIYYTPEILDLIVEKTNNYMRKPQDESSPYIRVNNWYLIYYREIYIYLAIRIYMTLHIDCYAYSSTSKFSARDCNNIYGYGLVFRTLKLSHLRASLLSLEFSIKNHSTLLSKPRDPVS
jgi:hypothetical protein